jgi:hypothetical protein
MGTRARIISDDKAVYGHDHRIAEILGKSTSLQYLCPTNIHPVDPEGQ